MVRVIAVTVANRDPLSLGMPRGHAHDQHRPIEVRNRSRSRNDRANLARSPENRGVREAAGRSSTAGSSPSSRVAVVGAGAAGLTAAWLLRRRHAVTLFEREGHWAAMRKPLKSTMMDDYSRSTWVSWSFNSRNYPSSHRLLGELGRHPLRPERSRPSGTTRRKTVRLPPQLGPASVSASQGRRTSRPAAGFARRRPTLLSRRAARPGDRPPVRLVTRGLSGSRTAIVEDFSIVTSWRWDRPSGPPRRRRSDSSRPSPTSVLRQPWLARH